MPRKKQGQATRVTERQSPDAKVKKITQNGLTKACNETASKIPHHKFLLFKAKKVSTTKVEGSFIQNGASVLLKGNRYLPNSIPVENLNNLHNTCEELKIASEAVQNVLERVEPDLIKTDTSLPNRTNEHNIRDLCLQLQKNIPCSDMNDLGAAFHVDEAASKRAGISVITRFNIAKDTSQGKEEKFDFLNCFNKSNGKEDSGISLKVKNRPESQQTNYRISSTVIETKSNISPNDRENSTVLISNKQHCSLSSVYGMPASNIENVLTGLPIKKHPQQSCLVLNSVSELPHVPIIISNSTLTVNCQNNGKTHSKAPHSGGNMTPKDRVTVNMSSVDCHLNRHILDLNSSEDSNSLPQAVEQKKVGIIPKVTSPQILEQHISKIISQNTAIVETLDPLWSKRYMRQSSQNAEDSKKSNMVANKNRRLSNDKIAIESGQSKLQSALLGTLNPERRSSFSFPKGEDTRERAFSTSSLPAARGKANFSPELPNLRMKIAAASEEELKGNAIKSLLSLKQGKYPSGNDFFQFSKDNYSQHPQNPEGSIIKDLLLKTKAETKNSVTDAEISKQKEFSLTFDNKSDKPFHCSKCGSKYQNEKALNVHSLLCNNKCSLSAGIPNETINNSRNGFLVSKFMSTENMTILNPLVLSSSIEDLLKNDQTPSVNVENECVGPILKTQLLSPLTNSKSPPLKKRKISEPMILPDNQKDSVNLSVPTVLPLDVANSSQRGRSQSVHLFGGKVQIHDGDKLKRLNALTNLSTLSSNCRSASYSEGSRDVTNAFQAVVTIAQPVHNSGDTVTHAPIKKMSPFPSIITIANEIGTGANISHAQSVSSEVRMMPELLRQTTEYDHFPNKMLNNVPVIQKTENLLKMKTSDSLFCLESLPAEETQKESTFLEKFETLSFEASSPDEPGLLFKNSDLHFESQAGPFAVIKQNVTQLIQKDETCTKEFNGTEQPAIMFTPSSPTRSSSKKEFSFSFSKPETKDKEKYLSPARPTSLPLKRKPFTMVGSTLISPDTPRPKKSCVQLYLNGQAYTYLGLKCSTRSTYCCIYRPQPMFVLQETDPKLSMYSNWQVVPAKEELGGMTPGQMLSFYNSRQYNSYSNVTSTTSTTTTAKLADPLSFTHSSYWKFRSSKKNNPDPSGLSELDHSAKATSTEEDIPEEAAVIPIHTSTQNNSPTPIEAEISVCNEDLVPSSLNRSLDPIPDISSNLEVEASVSDVEGTNTQDEDEDDDDRTEVNTDSSQSQPPKRVKIFEGGFKSNEDYTYIRGRGRGKYVCEECGIRCKKPSMLKKHIRTHTDLRPYKCRHCSFAFKTKGNLTKHMKSKAHHKKCTELGIIPVPTTSDDSQIDQEALAKQEQLRKKNLLFSDGEDIDDDDDDDLDDEIDDSDANDDDYESDSSSVTTSKIVSITNGPSLESDSTDNVMTEMDTSNTSHDPLSQCSMEQEAARSLLHLSSLSDNSQWASNTADLVGASTFVDIIPVSTTDKTEAFANASIIQHQQNPSVLVSNVSLGGMKRSADPSEEPIGHRPRSYSADVPFGGSREHLARQQQIGRNVFKALSDSAVDEDSEFSSREAGMRRYSISVAREARRPCIVQSPHCTSAGLRKIQSEQTEQPMDLRITRGSELLQGKHFIANFSKMPLHASEEMTTLMSSDTYGNETYPTKQLLVLAPQTLPDYDNGGGHGNSFVIAAAPVTEEGPGNASFSQSRHYYPSEDIVEGSHNRAENDMLEGRESPEASEYSVCSPVSPTSMEESFALQDGVGTANSIDDSHGISRNPSDFMKPGTSSNLEEGKCICRICNKIFAKAGQLRIHVNIHYFERPFRCDNCGVSFRTKGHLQKHKRSVSHYNKVNMNMTFGTPSVDNPRPFKCADCKIAFRIHGHLAKHLRSKMHIMKLECLGKLPFGMYAEMERSGVSLNEIDTTDCSNSLESLQLMAQKLYQRDPRRMRWHSPNHESPSDVEVTKCPSMGDALLPVPEQQLSVALNSPGAISVHVPSIVSLSPTEKSNENEVKHEPAESVIFPSNSVLVGGDIQLPSSSHYNTDQNRAVVSQPTTAPSESNISLHRSDTCHICGRMFKSAKFLQVHLYCDHSSWNPNPSETMAPSSPRMTVIAQDLSCDLCGRHFPNQTSLQQHLLTHAQLRPFVCEVCDAGFTSSASLVAHLGTHHTLDTGSTD